MRSLSRYLAVLLLVLPLVLSASGQSHNVIVTVTNGCVLELGPDVLLSLDVPEVPGDPIPVATGTSDISYTSIAPAPTRNIHVEVDIGGGVGVPTGTELRVEASAPVGEGQIGTPQGFVTFTDMDPYGDNLISGIGTGWATSTVTYELEVTDLSATLEDVTLVVLYTVTEI